MPQMFHKVMIAVDWLSLTLISQESFSHERISIDVRGRVDDVTVNKTIHIPLGHNQWIWSPRKYGTKQFRTIWEIGYVDEDGVVNPFGVMCADPTTPSVDPCLCTLKLDNSLLYREQMSYWLDMLRCFLADYCLRIAYISRCDLAADFLYLNNRLSGPQLVDKIKSLKWWKCGTTKVSEHYTLPYSIKSDSWQYDKSLGPTTYLQNQKLMSRVETLTFGTMSSDTQVCIYNKTLELNRTSVKIQRGGEEVTESAKEYIRDCHKLAGVYHPKRCTWRIEIRLKNKSLFIQEPGQIKERCIELTDLEPHNIFNTFVAASDKYFKLVDPTLGGTQEITPEYCATMATHKNRLPLVKLFPPATLVLKFSKKKYHQAANQFNRAVIKRLDELADRAKRVSVKYTKPGDKDLLPQLLERMPAIAERMQQDRTLINKAATNLTAVQAVLTTAPNQAAEEDIALIEQTREMLERHCNQESPHFVRRMISMLQKYSSRMLPIDEVTKDLPLRNIRCARPTDHEILLDAAEILKAIYVDVVYDERRAVGKDLYVQKFIDAISIINQNPAPPPIILDFAYQIVESNRFLSEEQIRAILAPLQQTDFWLLLQCNWDISLWALKLGYKQFTVTWDPPILPVGEERDLTRRLLGVTL